MATRNGGPTCPKVERLEELMERIADIRAAVENGDDNFGTELDEITSALDWLHTSLSNRKSYHQKRQAEQKLFMETAKKLLSADELEEIRKQAERQING